MAYRPVDGIVPFLMVSFDFCSFRPRDSALQQFSKLFSFRMVSSRFFLSFPLPMHRSIIPPAINGIFQPMPFPPPLSLLFHASASGFLWLTSLVSNAGSREKKDPLPTLHLENFSRHQEPAILRQTATLFFFSHPDRFPGTPDISDNWPSPPVFEL